MVFNQIAAGEVIERPASVVKELLENALDAGATNITIEVGFGGLTLIKIADNGHGIYAEDLPLAIAAHATSKLSQLTDLYAITTMGFRGEALASIAAVSRMTIYSKPADQSHAMLLKIDEFGVHTQVFARNQGTTIEIRDLFYNTPVRKTFLKSERLEYQAIELTVKQFALSAPHIAINFYHNQKPTLLLPPVSCDHSRLKRIKKLFGQAFLNDAILIQEQQESIAIQGWISQQAYQRSQRDKQWIYLNNRLIKDKLVLQAIGQAYQDLLHPGRYAACILYLTLPTDQVDINVHPTKYEVRFRDPRTIHAVIVSGLAKRLHAQVKAPELKTKPSTVNSQTALPSKRAQFPEVESLDWCILNQKFVIIRLLNSTPYLVDMLKLNHQFTEVALQAQPLPLAHRALLVPVRVTLTESAELYLEPKRAALANLGLQFDMIGPHHLLIRTMPLVLPWLDLERFFLSIQKLPVTALLVSTSHGVSESLDPAIKPQVVEIGSVSEQIPLTVDENILISQLIRCQTLDVYNLSSVERESLIDFCVQHWDSLSRIPVCVSLDATNCEQLMRFKRCSSHNSERDTSL